MNVKDKIATAFRKLSESEERLQAARRSVTSATKEIEDAKREIARVMKATGHLRDSIIHHGRIFRLEEDDLVIQELRSPVSVIAADDSVITIKPVKVEQ